MWPIASLTALKQFTRSWGHSGQAPWWPGRRHRVHIVTATHAGPAGHSGDVDSRSSPAMTSSATPAIGANKSAGTGAGVMTLCPDQSHGARLGPCYRHRLWPAAAPQRDRTALHASRTSTAHIWCYRHRLWPTSGKENPFLIFD
jgi:hypothetical protein